MNPIFQVHRLNKQGMDVAHELAHRYDELLEFVTAHGVEGRELSLVKTKLEEACFYSKKAVAQKKEHQE